MAERKATNKYYPPDYDPRKGSINKQRGQHPLRERARKLDEGILIIRFEMPFNIWCLGCEQHIGRGVRFNAEKKKVGEYYSTAIWSFRMKCHLCGNWMEIQTDPKKSEYIVVNGAKRKIETPDDEGGEVGVEAKELKDNPFFKLEYQVGDELKAKELVPKLTSIQDLNKKSWKDDYETSRILRRKFREEKKKLNEERSKVEAIKKKLSVDVELKDEKVEDILMARNLMNEKRTESIRDASQRIMNEPIFKGKRKNNDYTKLSFGIGDQEESVTEKLDFVKRNIKRKS